jgi:hypothetical protein
MAEVAGSSAAKTKTELVATSGQRTAHSKSAEPATVPDWGNENLPNRAHLPNFSSPVVPELPKPEVTVSKVAPATQPSVDAESGISQDPEAAVSTGRSGWSRAWSFVRGTAKFLAAGGILASIGGGLFVGGCRMIGAAIAGEAVATIWGVGGGGFGAGYLGKALVGSLTRLYKADRC